MNIVFLTLFHLFNCYQWAIRLKYPNSESYVTSLGDANKILHSLGFNALDHLFDGAIPGYFLIEDNNEKKDDGSILAERSMEHINKYLEQTDHIEWYEVQIPKKRVRRDQNDYIFNDPLYKNQWFLNNITDLPNLNETMSVLSLWQKGINGSRVQIAVVDDGFVI
jgi:hypothetical protein